MRVAHLQFWAGLFCGALLIVGAITLARSGEVRLWFGAQRIRRTEKPVSFWAFVSYMGAGGALIIGAVLTGFLGS